MNQIKRNNQEGQVVLITVLLFLFISLSVVLGFGAASVKSFKNTEDFTRSKQSYFTAESGLEDIAYRLSSGKTTAASQELVLNGATTTTTITPSGSGNEIISTGDYSSLNRKVRMLINPSATGASYSYGIQVGSGGLRMEAKEATVNGNVYVNGDISGNSSGGNSTVTGTAVAANKNTIDISQQNFLPVSPASSIDFDRVAGAQDFAQSFIPATTTIIKNVSFYIKKTSTPGAINNVYIMSNSGINPGAILATGSFDDAITTSYAWNNVTFSSNPTLTDGTIYWIVIDVGGSVSGTKYYTVAANTGVYTRGSSRTMTYNTAWNATTTADAYFRAPMGGIGSTLDHVDVGGDAIAYNITNSSVTGTLYCQKGSGNNKGCSATSTEPSPRDFTITQEMIDGWKADAEAGGTVSGYNIGSNTTLGPKKIDGSLTTSAGVMVTLTGTVWITGGYTPGGGMGQGVTLDVGYGDNSGVIIVDGNVDLSNNITFSGAPGHPKSFVLVLSTNTSGSAITVGNNAGAVLLDAPYGTIQFNNNAATKESTAKELVLKKATVTYDTGLVDAHFSSGPSSGGGISGWKEVQ